MTFLSFNYLLFLSITFIAYYTVNNKSKYWVIFFSSIIFITLISINVLLFSILYVGLNYFGGLLLYKKKENINSRKVIFWFFLSLNVGILVFFKYINFIFENINSFLELFQTSKIHAINLILPVGISYYTFQSIGYLFRINRGFETPEKNVIKFSCFLLFFPKFLSGPVERSNHFLPQISNLSSINQDAVSGGLRLILLGVFKKLVIAENLYYPVNLVYSNVHEYSGTPLVFVLFIQLIYIYTDFSGYTDIALGSAKLLGIDIMDNFKRPFLARSITEFWKRWHISLSSWCNEFIYLPFIIKYRKLGSTAAVLGIFITFTIIGIWHGANWTFVVLGLLQALAISYEFFTKRHRLKFASNFPIWVTNIASRILVFTFMSLSLVFFFSKSLSDAFYFTTHLFENIKFKTSGFELLEDRNKFLNAIFWFIVLFTIEIINEKGEKLQKLFLEKPRLIRWSIYYVMILLIYYNNVEVSS